MTLFGSPSSSKEGEILFMGEALLTRTGGSSSSGGGANGNFHTEIITSNTLWKVPENLKNNQVSVRIFGAGGNASTVAGGNGGAMNNKTINLYGIDTVPIFIGAGGGSSFFGNYLSAPGGGGSGGGASPEYMGWKSGLSGTQFGGGGAARESGAGNNIKTESHGGSGGTWGGGGGGAGTANINGKHVYNFVSTGVGNGGSNTINATNGVNTIGMGLEFEGAGLGGGIYGGGGGYGGNGGNGVRSGNAFAGGGGGGYGARGGHGYINTTNGIHRSAGGGGGGYGGRGGDGYANNTGSGNGIGGGGGGYGLHGNGGEYVPGTGFTTPGFAAGSAGGYPGGPGICIIQYYTE